MDTVATLRTLSGGSMIHDATPVLAKATESDDDPRGIEIIGRQMRELENQARPEPQTPAAAITEVMSSADNAGGLAAHRSRDEQGVGALSRLRLPARSGYRSTRVSW